MHVHVCVVALIILDFKHYFLSLTKYNIYFVFAMPIKISDIFVYSVDGWLNE